MKTKVIVLRKNEYLIDQNKLNDHLPDAVLFIPAIYGVSTLRLANGVEISWKRERYANTISANYNGVQIYETPALSDSDNRISTVLGVINSFKDNTKQELKELLNQSLTRQEAEAIKRLSELRKTQEVLKTEINGYKQIKKSLEVLSRSINNFLSEFEKFQNDSIK